MNTDTTITPEALQTQKPLNIPTAPQDTTNYSGIVSSVSDSIAGQYNQYNNQLNQAQESQQGTANDISKLLGELAGRTQAEQSAAEQAGVNTETQNLNKTAQQLFDLNSQASSLNREAQAIPLQVQQESLARGVTDRGVQPIQTGRLRDNAIKALSIAQQSDIAQASLMGSQIKLQQAKDKAQQIVDLEFKPKEMKLEQLKAAYELNKDYLSTVDKKRTESLQLNIKKEEDRIASEKANAKAIGDMVVQAASQGASPDLLNRAKNAKSGTDAAMILGQYAGDYYKTELLKQQIATEKAQRSKIYSDISISKQKLANSNTLTNTYGKPVKVSNAEIVNLNSAIISKNNLNSLVTQYKDIIERTGTQTLYGEDAGARESLKASILLEMKNLEKTGALDKGSTDVLEGNIPNSQFFNTEAGQTKKLTTLLNTVTSKTDEYIDSYKGTTAESDPRVSRAYKTDDTQDFEKIYNNVNSNMTTTKSFISGFNFNKE